VDAGDFFAMVPLREVEGEPGNSLRFCASDDFEGFNNSWDRLML